jgi:hypothetical protein
VKHERNTKLERKFPEQRTVNVSKWRDYSNAKIYSIIGGVKCERKEGGNFICRNRAALAPKESE